MACQLTRDLTSMHGMERDGETLADGISGIAAVLVEQFCGDQVNNEL